MDRTWCNDETGGMQHALLVTTHCFSFDILGLYQLVSRSAKGMVGAAGSGKESSKDSGRGAKHFDLRKSLSTSSASLSRSVTRVL